MRYYNLKRRFHVGVDLGKRKNYSAVAVVEECVWATGEQDRVSYAPVVKKLAMLHYIQRLGKGLEYLQVVEKVQKLLLGPQLRDEEVVLALDATGVGEPVFEMVQKMYWDVQAQRGKWLNLAAVVFTNGQETTWKNYHAFVPKNTLLEGLQLDLELGKLRFPEGLAGLGELQGELRNMNREMGVKQQRWVSMGKHDDLVMALALAGWGRTFRRLGMGWADMTRGLLHWPGELG